MLLRSVLTGIKSLLRPGKRNAEIEADVRSFRESAVEHKMRDGLSREAAEREARAEIRSMEMVRHRRPLCSESPRLCADRAPAWRER